MANSKRRKLQVQRNFKPLPKPKKQKSQGSGKNDTSQPKKKHQQQHREHEQPIIPFDPQDRILLIGEGDLSFAASIIEHHGCANVTATVLEKDHAELVAKYPAVDDNISVILGPQKGVELHQDEESAGDADDSDAQDEHDAQEDQEANNHTIVTHTPPRKRKPSKLSANNRLFYSVDATKLPSSVTRPVHDHILFNFPHVGGKSTDVNRQVRYNQELLVAFFRSALRALAPHGSIVVTLFEGEPYTLWNIRDLGRHAGLQVERSFRFQAAAYPGYRHARTLGVVRNKKGEATGGGWKGEERLSRSYVFRRKGEVPAVQQKKKRRREEDEDDSSDGED